MQAQVLVITSGKGGVGKSSVSVMLGLSLARRGKKTLLLELDTGLRTADILTGTQRHIVYDLADVLYGRCSIGKAIVVNSFEENFHTIPASADATQILPRLALCQLMEALRPHYDFILVDSPAGLQAGFSAAAELADRAVVVVTPDPVCVRDAFVAGRRLYETGLEDVRLIINRVPHRFVPYETLRDLDDVIDQTEIPLLGVIPQDAQFAAFMARGYCASLEGKVKKVFDNIAARILGEDKPLEIQ